MLPIDLPHIEDVSEMNKNYVDYFNKKVGHIPNLYISMMHSDNAFNTYYTFQRRKTSLSLREREVVSLVVAQVNNSHYCLSAHTMIAKLNGFSEAEIMQLRRGKAGFDRKLDALARLVKDVAEKKGSDISAKLDSFYSIGYTREHLIDTLQAIGENIISNLTAKSLGIPIDFPLAKDLHENI